MEDPLRAGIDRAREHYAAGAVAEAVRGCVGVVEGSSLDTDPSLVASAATLVRRPLDPLLRARVHALATESLALLRRIGPAGDEAAVRVAAQVEATRDVFREDELIPVEDSADAEAEFVEIQAGISSRQAPLSGDARLKLARRAIALGVAAADRELQAWGRLWSMDVHAATGRRVELFGELSALAVLAEQLGPAWRSKMLLVHASQALIDGRFGDVVRLADEAATVGGPHSDAEFLQLPFAFEAARHQGTTEPMLDAVRRQVDQLPFVARTWLCVALKGAGRREEADDEWRALAGRVTAVPSEAPEFLMTIADAADVCAWLGDEASAATLYDILLPYEHLHVIAHAHAPYQGPVGLALGRLARVLGDLPTAAEHLRSTLARAEDLHALPTKAYVLAELAAIEPIRSRARRELADDAAELARRLDMAPLVDQIDALFVSWRRAPRAHPTRGRGDGAGRPRPQQRLDRAPTHFVGTHGRESRQQDPEQTQPDLPHRPRPLARTPLTTPRPADATRARWHEASSTARPPHGRSVLTRPQPSRLPNSPPGRRHLDSNPVRRSRGRGRQSSCGPRSGETGETPWTDAHHAERAAACRVCRLREHCVQTDSAWPTSWPLTCVDAISLGPH